MYVPIGAYICADCHDRIVRRRLMNDALSHKPHDGICDRRNEIEPIHKERQNNETMRRKYRIRIKTKYGRTIVAVQVRGSLGLWVDVKRFCEPGDNDFALREAKELVENLEES